MELSATYALKGEAGGAGITAQSVAGVVSVPVTHGFTYELTATGDSTITLTGEDGAQVAAVLATGGFAVTIAGNVLTNGTYVARKQTAGWVLYPVGTARTDITPPIAGTLGVAVTETTGALTVTGAMDDVARHANPYRYSEDDGTT